MTEFSHGTGHKRTCRFFRKDFPDVDEVVMVYVKSFKRDDPGATAELLEYDGLEGMILTSELSKRRIRSVYKLLPVGSREAVKVLRVDREKGYIDLSKRQADRDEKKECEDRYYRSKTVQSILYKSSRKLDVPLLQLYETVAWPLADVHGHALLGFHEAARKGSVMYDLPGVPKEHADVILSYVRRKLAAKAVTLSVEVELSCFQEIGINGIRLALQKAIDAGSEALPVAATVIAAPLYRLTVNSADVTAGEKQLRAAINAAEEEIRTYGGRLVAHEMVIPEQETLSDSESDEE